jgi:hypothetical protein
VVRIGSDHETAPDGIAEGVHDAQELCETWDKAVERVRALTMECLPRLKAGMSLESHVVSELQHQLEFGPLGD